MRGLACLLVAASVYSACGDEPVVIPLAEPVSVTVPVTIPQVVTNTVQVTGFKVTRVEFDFGTGNWRIFGRTVPGNKLLSARVTGEEIAAAAGVEDPTAITVARLREVVLGIALAKARGALTSGQ